MDDKGKDDQKQIPSSQVDFPAFRYVIDDRRVHLYKVTRTQNFRRFSPNARRTHGHFGHLTHGEPSFIASNFLGR